MSRLPAGEPLARHTTLAAQVAPWIFLTTAFIFDFQALDLVSRYGGEELPMLYRISAVWGGRAGPLLLWAAIMGTVTWFMSGRAVSNSVEIRLMHGCTAAIIVISWILSPFADSTGWRGTLNPLLQTNLMVIHPPLVFAYYSLCLAVASIALAGLIKGSNAREVHEAQLHWARAGFLIGTIGIGLGGLWAYTVLDWGGYWAWDPVETGSILPWFALLMIVHARARTDSEKESAIIASPALGMLAGALAIHATLVTRANGVWASVHSFVGNEEARQYNDPYIRIVQLFDDGAAGLEVAAYFLIMISLCFAAFLWLVKQQEKLLNSSSKSSMIIENPQLSIVLLIATIALGIWMGSTAVTFVGGA
ncbi:MAG: cytochrome c biogenesis protein CcsA, partial [Euryarchaeota archaeon]